MLDFIINHGLNLVLSLISAGALAYAHFIGKKINHLKDLTDNERQQRLEQKIDEKLQPINDKLAEDYSRFESLKSYFRYIIIEDCQLYLNHGSMTNSQYQKLSEIFKVYHGMGGNSQAEEYYHKTIELPIREEQ